jgi:hypothetical protein
MGFKLATLDFKSFKIGMCMGKDGSNQPNSLPN